MSKRKQISLATKKGAETPPKICLFTRLPERYDEDTPVVRGASIMSFSVETFAFRTK